MDHEKTGALIAARRKELGLTQAELAAKLKISISRCAPLFSRSTSPGFGAHSASWSRARWAQRAMAFALSPSKCARMMPPARR
ncbi:MAG: helix-turn-helix domain-containing protein [Clostridia bacterium]|nr:helix-turn-helix domain-containing protein [Clostridia bacterium]